MITKNITIDMFSKNVQLEIFDYNYYKSNNKDNEGLDIISKCLESNDNCWEPYQTEIIKEILKDGNNIFIDIGHHIGYYSVLAGIYNNLVYSIDYNDNYINLCKANIALNNLNNITLYKKFVDKNFNLNEIIPKDTHIKLIKCDIEGYENDFINSIWERFENKSIENLIMEISPKFNNLYPNNIIKIKNYGYNIYDIGLSPQRKLDDTITLQSLDDKLLNIADIESMMKYLDNLEYGQTNFLFVLSQK